MAATTGDSTPDTYIFGRTAGGIHLGLDGPAMVGAGVAVAVVVVELLVAGLLAATVTAVVAAVVLWAPAPGGERLRVAAWRVAAWAVRTVTGRAGVPSTPPAFGPGPPESTAAPWGDLTIHAAADGRAVVEVDSLWVGVWDWLTAVDFALVDVDEQSRLLAGWAGLLDSLPPAVARIQWLVATTPDHAAAPAVWLRDHVSPSAADPAVEDYGAALGLVGSAARRRRIRLAVAVQPRRPSLAAAVSELAAFDRRLHAAGVSADPLDQAAVEAVLAEAADPADLEAAQLRSILRQPTPPPSPPWWREDPDAVVTDGVWHRTLIAMQLPRIPVGGDWLWPLLSAAPADALRTVVAATWVPVARWRAEHAAESAVASAESELRHRSRAGFAVHARDEMVLQAHARREDEVAAGAATFGLSLSATVSAASRPALRRACDDLQAAWRSARCQATAPLGRQHAGWLTSLPLAAPPPAARHVATTVQARSIYPAQVALGGGGGGVVIGRDVLAGGAWSFDPWSAYQSHLVTSPNLAVIGQVGRGKSSVVKALIGRGVGVFGRRAWVLDPKGEYGPLAAQLGLPTIRLAPGGDVRANPLDAPAGLGGEDLARHRSALVEALAAAELGRPLTVRERAAVDEACRLLPAEPVLGDVAALLLDPPAELAGELATSTSALAAEIREAGLAVHRLVAGRLRGMFDGRSTVVAGAGGVIDLTAAYSDPGTLGPVLAAATAWIAASLRTAEPTFLVVDEAWAVLSVMADFLRSSAKLSRSLGLSLVLVLHRVSDLAAAGDDSAAVTKRAAGLWQDVETRLIFAQQASEAALLGESLGLSAREVDLLPSLRRGRCLAVVGAEHHLVDVVLTDREAATTDTDVAMRAALAAPGQGVDDTGVLPAPEGGMS